MEALLKSGNWVEIDTKCLFNDQYNTTEKCGNKRIFDGDIILIQGDVRKGLGKCRYCGKIVKFGEEENHFKEEEAKKAACDMESTEHTCFYKSKKYIGKNEVSSESKTEVVDGIATTITSKTVIEKWHPYCSYKKGEIYGMPRCECTCDEHRTMGIEWFTEDNTFFLRYPAGVGMRVKINPDDYENKSWNAVICNEKFNSYTLKINYTKEDDEYYGISFVLSNAREHIPFVYDAKKDIYLVFEGINNSPRMRKGKIFNHYRKTKSDEQVEDKLKKWLVEFLK